MFFCILVLYGLCSLIPSPSGEIPLHLQNLAQTRLLWFFPREVTPHALMYTLFRISCCLPLALCSITFIHSKDICWEYLPISCHTLCEGAGDISQNKTDKVSSLTDVMQQDIDYPINIQKCLITIMISVIKDSGCVSMYKWKPNLIWGDQGESFPLKGHLSRNWKISKTNQAKIIRQFPRHKEQHVQRPWGSILRTVKTTYRQVKMQRRQQPTISEKEGTSYNNYYK